MSAPLKVLFLCTHNSARSILSEALLNHYGAGKFKAFSAGSSPRDNQKPNPLALQALQSIGIDTAYLSSKSWDVFAGADTPYMDLIITVCDNAAGEVCPYWPGKPATAHWGYADPSNTVGTDEEQLAAFVQTMHLIAKRIRLLIALPIDKLQPQILSTTAKELSLQ
jgi:protein-tyrosine-phosphatase